MDKDTLQVWLLGVATGALATIVVIVWVSQLLN